MSVEQAEYALLEETFSPTGDRTTDLVLSACAGTPISDYNDEILPTTRERAWCHAALSGTALPTLDLAGTSGYELTHRVFYATDFARKPLLDLAAVAAV